MLVARGSTRWLVVLGKASDMLISRPSAQDALMTLNELDMGCLCGAVRGCSEGLCSKRARAKKKILCQPVVHEHEQITSSPAHPLTPGVSRKQHHFSRCDAHLLVLVPLARSYAHSRP